MEEANDTGFNARLDGVFEKVIHRLYHDTNASGENAAFWRRVFYDFRKMHFFVFRNHLPETIMELAAQDETEGHSLIEFLRSGQSPEALQDPNMPRFRGVIGESMKAPLFLIMRELRRLEILDARFDAACFYMNSPARRVVNRMGWIADESVGGGAFSELVELSRVVHQRMQGEVPELASFFDLPLQLFAYKNL